MSEEAPAVPRHIAVIMDGNGRWAKQRGLKRIKGHEAGAESARAVLHSAREAGVEVLTLYAFSSENWKRPQDEVQGLMTLLPKMLIKHERILHDHETRLRVIGRLHELPDRARKELQRVMDNTEAYSKHQLVLALNYGSRQELADAAKAIAAKAQQGSLNPEEVDEACLAEHLYAPDLPDPDFLIRTSGEQRLSNYLLWQLSYAEFYFAPEFWPDFREDAFAKALEVFQGRQRRYGGLSA